MTTALTVDDDRLNSLIDVLDEVRGRGACTRSHLASTLGLSRAVVAQRVGQLLDWNLIEEAELAPSTGGRAARALRFRSENALVLSADVNAGRLTAAISYLDGQPISMREEPGCLGESPEETLKRIATMFEELLVDCGPQAPPLWAVAVGLAGPVEYASGRPIAQMIMPGWDRFPIRRWLNEHFQVPVWVDNDVNMMLVGEQRAGVARDVSDVILVKVSAGIGAALISRGSLHRGHNGVAGDIAHLRVVEDETIVCGCGQTGCLEAVAGGDALGRQATSLLGATASRALTRAFERDGEVSAAQVLIAAAQGDPLATSLLARSSRYVGSALAGLVNFFNPEVVVVAGGLPDADDLYLAGVRQSIYDRALPHATRELRVLPSALGFQASLMGAALVAVDELFSREWLTRWIAEGSPRGLVNV